MEAALEQEAIGEFEAYLDLPDELPKAATDAASLLSQIGDVSGVKPALVYAFFVPPNVATQALPARQARSSLAVMGRQDQALAATKSLTTASSDSSLSREAATTLRYSTDALRSAQGQKEPLANGDDQLELVVVTADGKPVRRLVPGATRRRVLQVVHQFLE